MRTSPQPPRPTEVRRGADSRAIGIRWHDGHYSEFPYPYARGWCPCAGCQGHSNTVRFIPAGDPDLSKIAVVGNYALSLTWSDGHDTGIYPYARLRELCPCADCGGPKTTDPRTST